MPITTAGGLGAAVTPEQWASYVLEHLSAQSVVLASGATRVDTANRLIHVPRVLVDGAANFYGELEEITADCPTGDELILTPKKVAALCQMSDEAVSDSSPALLDVVGTSLTRSVALRADAAILNGKGDKEPTGVLGQAGGAPVAGPLSIDALITAAGEISGVGGNPRVVYVNPVDQTQLMLSKDDQGRPLLGPDYTGGPSSTVYGLTLWPTPAMPAGQALVADPSQIVVAVREDATVAISTDVLFTSDGTVARVVARLDAGVNDPRGLVVIGAAAQTMSSKSSKS